MIHEIGHNLGAHHHKEQNYQPGPHTWLNSYSAGWRFEWNANWYNTLMSYSGGHFFDPPAPGAGITSIEIGYFSNPDLVVAGTDIKLGHPADGDNARTLRETKHRVAAFRDGTVNGAAELVIESLEVEPATSELGTELTATMVIKNRGTADVTRNFWIDFYENLASSPHPHQDGDQNWQFGYLEAGAAHKFTYHFTPENTGTKYAWGQVDTGTQVSDSPALFGPVTYTITAPPPCAVSTPDPPSGPGSGETNTSYTYFTGGASCAAGHSVQYRFDWGDGAYSAWSALAGRSKSWSTAGSYQLRVQARCAEDNRVLSDWSKGKQVTISKAEPVPYILDQAVFNVDGIPVAVCLDDYSAAFKIKGNLLWDFLRGDQDFPDAQAVGSGGKYIDLDQYCDNYIDNVSEAVKNSNPLPAEVVATFKTIAGFDADGNPVLIPINSAGAEG